MYYPNLKTSDSELRAIRFLDAATKKRIIPIFELTRSRKTKAVPDGSIVRRMEQLNEAYGNGRFILDLSTEDDLMNWETNQLFDEDNGYANWIKFLGTNVASNVIPCALYIDEGGKENFQSQVKQIVKKYGKVCIRTSVADEVTSKLYGWASEVTRLDTILVCGILYYIEPHRFTRYQSLCREFIERVLGNKIPSVVLFAGSSFPRFVTDLEGNADLKGEFEAREITLENDIRQRFPNLPIESSDFASVHPIRYQTGGGNWIPRIDIFDGAAFHYVRARRADGGYDSAARELDTHAVARLPDCWGKKQIQLAMSGRVAGGSPSFWISVRINCWITQRAT